MFKHIVLNWSHQMSNLKYLSLRELMNVASDCEKYIDLLKNKNDKKYENKINGQKERLKWIDHYIALKIDNM